MRGASGNCVRHSWYARQSLAVKTISGRADNSVAQRRYLQCCQLSYRQYWRQCYRRIVIAERRWLASPATEFAVELLARFATSPLPAQQWQPCRILRPRALDCTNHLRAAVSSLSEFLAQLRVSGPALPQHARARHRGAQPAGSTQPPPGAFAEPHRVQLRRRPVGPGPGALLALFQAANRYDHRRGNRFSTHAIWWIRQ